MFRPTCGAHLPVAAGDPPGGASRDVERRRRADYGALAPGVRWRPFVLDTWGHLGPGTVRFLEELAEERGGRRRRRGAWATVEGAYGGDDAEDPTAHDLVAGGMEAAHLRGGGEAGGPDHLSPCCGGLGGPVGGCCHGSVVDLDWMYESVVSGMMEGRGVGAGLGGCRGGPFIPALGPGERLPSIGLWGVVLCRVDWTHLGWFPSHWARLGATLGGAVGEPAWDTVTLGTPLLMPVGGFWCSWCFSPLGPF